MKQTTFKPFTSPSELDHYFSQDELICHECGKHYQFLGRHIAMHDLTPNEYKDKWGIPRKFGLVGSTLRKRYTTNLSERKANGSIKYDKKKVLEGLKSIDYQNLAPQKPVSITRYNENFSSFSTERTNSRDPVLYDNNGRDKMRRREYFAAYDLKRNHNDNSLMKAYKKKYNIEK